MSLAFAPTVYSIEEYLDFERAAEERHEYLDGYIYKMAGEGEEHADICASLSGLLYTQLRGTPCRGRIANTKVRSGPLPLSPRSSKGLFSYSDVFVVCDPIQYHDEFRDIVINPVVIFEVLSPSTEEFDRDIKFERYDRWNPSLQDYLLVAQNAPKIEHYTRQADGSWRYRVYRGLEAGCVIESIKCSLSLADVYERVTFPPPPTPKLQVVPKKQPRTRKQKPAAKTSRSQKRSKKK
ncbi:MAG: Uma2 family endonuclease [Acidobacteria bacterium]|nr:Uma2 family endonuclease [Acidobacteriota bacterium]MBI3422716.1 Uma2 family endonuclease [Acidobacteriota bacterium]